MIAHRNTKTVAALLLAIAATSCRPGGSPAEDQSQPLTWPPTLGQAYPDITLPDQQGTQTRLSDLRGKVVLLELIGMDCPACNAFSGANMPSVGPYEGVAPQKGLEYIGRYVKQYADVELSHPDVVFVQLLLYNVGRSGPPTSEDTDKWAKHFDLQRERSEIVLQGDERFIGRASMAMIPGFHLIDREGVFRSDSAGHKPRHDLFKETLPLLGKLVKAQ